MSEQDVVRRVCVALDLPSGAAALALADDLKGLVGGVKVGLELFIAEGPQIVRALRAEGHDVFLDLKLHDIPNTVRRAAALAGALGVAWLTVHASGGRAMVEAAVEGATEGATQAGHAVPKVLAVTVLTSLGQADLAALGYAGELASLAERLAIDVRSAGAAGVVCSPREARRMRATLGAEALVVTPGVRPLGTAAADQRRTATPAQALEAGADMLVIGRPIVAAVSPREAARTILESLKA